MNKIIIIIEIIAIVLGAYQKMTCKKSTAQINTQYELQANAKNNHFNKIETYQKPPFSPVFD